MNTFIQVISLLGLISILLDSAQENFTKHKGFRPFRALTLALILVDIVAILAYIIEETYAYIIHVI